MRCPMRSECGVCDGQGVQMTKEEKIMAARYALTSKLKVCVRVCLCVCVSVCQLGLCAFSRVSVCSTT